MKGTGIILAAALALAAPVAAAAGEVDINTASAEELAAALDGVGAVRAQAIVDYRDEHGPYPSAAALADVSGIGEATLEQNRALITVGDGD